MLNPDVRDILTRARARIADPAKWTQGALARPSNNHTSPAVAPSSTYAACWCAEGAIKREAAEQPTGTIFAGDFALNEMNKACDTSPHIWHFNDTHTHAEVLALFDKVLTQ